MRLLPLRSHRRTRRVELLNEVAYREELGLARKADLLEHGANHLAEALEGLLRFPDVDDTPTLVGRTGDVRENPIYRPVAERVEAATTGQAGHYLLVLFAGTAWTVVHHHYCHLSSKG